MIVGECARETCDGDLRLKRVERFLARYTGLNHRENIAPADHGYAECLDCGRDHECIRPEGSAWGTRFPDEDAFTSRRWHYT